MKICQTKPFSNKMQINAFCHCSSFDHHTLLIEFEIMKWNRKQTEKKNKTKPHQFACYFIAVALNCHSTYYFHHRNLVYHLNDEYLNRCHQLVCMGHSVILVHLMKMKSIVVVDQIEECVFWL